MRKVLTFILAGGKGERLYPLTRDRAKPAVPFGGVFRIIDFTLSNCINSGIRKVHVLTQYKSRSLQRHLRCGWNIFNAELGEYIDIIPAQQRIGSDWYKGTADAIYQNFYSIVQENPQEILILSGDHVYKMNYYRMIGFHRQNKADLTIAVAKVPKDKAYQLGVIQVDRENRVLGFIEKPQEMPPTAPEDSNYIYVSMGIYLFNRKVLEKELKEDAKKETEHDFGRNIIPQMIKERRKIIAYNFSEPQNFDFGRTYEDREVSTYWRDIGTIDAYYEANMDLIKSPSIFNLYDLDWPIRTYQEQFPPVRISAEKTKILNSLISSGCIVDEARIVSSILSPNVFVGKEASICDSILMEGVRIGSRSKIKRAIIDKDVEIPQNTSIGYNLKEDKKRFFVTESKIVVVAKKTKVK